MLCTNGPSSYGSLSASLSAWGIAEQCDIARFGDTETVKRGVELGLGLAQVARVSVARELAEGRLKAIRLASPAIHRDLLLVQHKYASQSTAAGVFASFLRVQAGTLLGGL
ncbi:MAG TPA: LysR substrate-binding domain-containing protein [Chloroflexota bacterium]|jgi:DNA-binding transcriptional LysR family regulator